MNNRKNVIALLLFFCSILITLSLLILSFTYIYLSKREPPISTHGNVYQFISSNSLRKESSLGLVEHPRSISRDEFIGYTNEATGNYIFISQLGDKKYECTGTCFCAGFKEERRFSNSGTLLSRSLYVVLSALSVSLAIKFAEETFRQNCISEFSQNCESNEIISEVSKCSEVDHLVDGFQDFYDFKNKLNKEDKELLGVYDDLRERGLDPDLARDVIRNLKKETSKENDNEIQSEEETNFEEKEEKFGDDPSKNYVLEFDCSGNCENDDISTSDEDHELFVKEFGKSYCSDFKMVSTVKIPNMIQDVEMDPIELAKMEFFLDFRPFCVREGEKSIVGKSGEKIVDKFCKADSGSISCREMN